MLTTAHAVPHSHALGHRQTLDLVPACSLSATTTLAGVQQQGGEVGVSPRVMCSPWLQSCRCGVLVHTGPQEDSG